MILVKNLADAENWTVYHGANTSAPETDFLALNTTNATSDSNTVWNDTAPTSSVFSVGSSGKTNGSGDATIAYCFAEKTGYSKFGSYTGTGVEEGSFTYLGFKPAFVMVKRTNTTSDWVICDSTRDTDNGVFKKLFPNLSQAEDSYVSFDFLSNGFKLRTDNGGINGGGDPHIYMAFAEAPLVGSNNVPCTAR